MRTQLFLALIPLVLFWGAEEFFGLKVALVVGCAAAVVEVGWEWARSRRVSFVTLASNGLVLGLGLISFLLDSGVAFKLQPAVMELGIAGFMATVRWSGDPFLLRTFREMRGLDEGKRKLLLEQAWFIGRLRRLDRRLLLFFVVHGLAVAWAAVWGSTRTWIVLKGVVFYVLLVLIMVPMYKRPRARVQ